MRRTIVAALITLATVSSGCGDIIFGDDDWRGWDDWDHSFRVRGSGVLATEVYGVEGFDALTAWGVGRVIIRETGRERLTVTGDDNVLPYLEVEVRNGTLEFGPESGVDFSLRHELVFEVEVVDLKRIDASGAVEVEATFDWQPALWVTLSGATGFDGSGAVDRLDVDVSGASRFMGRNLESLRARVQASGASTATVWAIDRLEGSASGVAVVHYVGDPVVDVDVSGLASVVRY